MERISEKTGQLQANFLDRIKLFAFWVLKIISCYHIINLIFQYLKSTESFIVPSIDKYQKFVVERVVVQKAWYFCSFKLLFTSGLDTSIIETFLKLAR